MQHSKEVLNQFAKLAAESYLTKKTSLNTSLSKIAKSESLEPHQIEYVAATANHAVWERLHGMDKKASYDFPLADPAAVLKDLQIKPVIVKQASEDYLSSPSDFGGFAEKTASFELDSLDKIAAKKRKLKKELQNRFEKCSVAKDELSRQMTVLHSRYELAERDFVKQARNMVMEEPFEERGQVMCKMAEFVHSACGEAELARGLMKKLAHVMRGQGLIKTADLKAPEEYISETMPAKIVNGRHSLYITIQTLKNIRQEYDPLHRAHEIVDSSLPEIKEKIRGL